MLDYPKPPKPWELYATISDATKLVYMRLLIYLAIPINLCLWGVKAWAIAAKNLCKLQVFCTRSIRSILKISIYDVKDNHIHNSEILKMINLPTMDNIIAKMQLRWIGKMARTDKNRLPIKMLSYWINSPRPSRRPHTTIRNTMVKSLQPLDSEIASVTRLIILVL
jgi:hypothetical protein